MNMCWRFWGRDGSAITERMRVSTFTIMMVPQVATMIPLYKMISGMHMLNTVWGFMLLAEGITGAVK